MDLSREILSKGMVERNKKTKEKRKISRLSKMLKNSGGLRQSWILHEIFSNYKN